MNYKKIGLITSVASILLSIGVYASYDENLGIFVGLWASALLLITDRFAEMQE